MLNCDLAGMKPEHSHDPLASTNGLDRWAQQRPAALCHGKTVCSGENAVSIEASGICMTCSGEHNMHLF